MNTLAFQIGAILGAYCVLRLLMFACRKIRREPNSPVHICAMGFLTLVVVTVVGGFGMQDYAPEPIFLKAAALYFYPTTIATCIELLRTKFKQSGGIA